MKEILPVFGCEADADKKASPCLTKLPVYGFVKSTLEDAIVSKNTDADGIEFILSTITEALTIASASVANEDVKYESLTPSLVVIFILNG